jgi:hypothetical protein
MRSEVLIASLRRQVRYIMEQVVDMCIHPVIFLCSQAFVSGSGQRGAFGKSEGQNRAGKSLKANARLGQPFGGSSVFENWRWACTTVISFLTIYQRTSVSLVKEALRLVRTATIVEIAWFRCEVFGEAIRVAA